jgi:hypothetical protein
MTEKGAMYLAYFCLLTIVSFIYSFISWYKTRKLKLELIKIVLIYDENFQKLSERIRFLEESLMKKS